jgi:hypothetical protein
MGLEGIFWSSKKPAVELTVVTGLNTKRLHQLESQCRSYRGPLSAAVYVVLHNPDKLPQLTQQHRGVLKEAVQAVSQLHAR